MSEDTIIQCSLSGRAVYIAVKNYLKDHSTIQKAVENALAVVLTQDRFYGEITKQIATKFKEWTFTDKLKQLVSAEVERQVADQIRHHIKVTYER